MEASVMFMKKTSQGKLASGLKQVEVNFSKTFLKKKRDSVNPDKVQPLVWSQS